MSIREINQNKKQGRFCEKSTDHLKKFTLLVMLLLNMIALFGQSDILLNEPVIGNTEVSAPNSISLSAGFRTTPGSVFKAYIGPNHTTGGTISVPLPSTGSIPGPGSSNQNFVKTISYLEPKTSIPSDAFKQVQVIQYFDGLGRLIQTNNVAASPSLMDIIQPVIYDEFGREAIKTLPYAPTRTGSEVSGEFRSGVSENTVNGYYSLNPPSGVEADNRAFTQIVFDNSPLNRTLSKTGPGIAWTNKSVKYDYLTNSTPKKSWKVTGVYSYSEFYYPINSLFITVSIDEENDSTLEYKDKLGQVVLKESQIGTNFWTRTAYIYDDLGLLRRVIPPKAVGPDDDALCFKYEYDTKNRMIEKKIPGGGITKMVYDQRDRLRCSQNSTQAETNDWSYIKYDTLNRPIITGVVKNFNGDIYAAATKGYINELRNNTSENNGYTNRSFPLESSGAEVHTVTYYDDYEFMLPLNERLKDTLKFEKYGDIYGNFSKKDASPIGRITGTMKKVLKGESSISIDNELLSVIYYDKFGHVLMTISENHLGGKDVLMNKYENISWLVQQSRQEHYKGSEKITLDKTFEYDHSGRLLATRQRINAQDEITLSSMVYNELGQLVTKYLHSPQVSGNRSFLQKLDFQYNIRGWLTKINDPGLTSDNDLFGMQLSYNNTDGLSSQLAPSALYNGNIAGIRWNIKEDKQRAYSFTYDKLNRLKTSNYADGSALTDNVGAFSESVLEYDDNGNIKKLQRKYEGTLVDDLTYSYENNDKSNRLQQVADLGTANQNVDDFPDKTAGYTYDYSGNMKTDGSRNTTLSYFPSLNLPNSIDFSSNNKIFYYYTPDGNKLVKRVYSTDGQTSSENTTHYIGNIVYQEGKLLYIITEEGRLMAFGEGNERKFINEYSIRDHLGNTRVAFMGSSLGGSIDVVQRTNYYPFGLVMNPGTNNINSNPSYSKNKYLYNGKEIQDDKLNGAFFGMYDYGARFYDAQIGRWHSVDPKAQRYIDISVFGYCANNPIKFKDPNGKELVYYGNGAEVVQIIQALMRQFNAGSMKIDFIRNNDKVITGFKATQFITNDKSNNLTKYLVTVINSKDVITLEKAKNTPHMVDPVEGFGGMKFQMNPDGTNKKILMTDQWFTGNWYNSGMSQPSYKYLMKSKSFWHDDYEAKRIIPFEEALAHELIHGARAINKQTAGYIAEENAVIDELNIWREQRGIERQGRLKYANFFQSFYGVDVLEDLYEYEK